MSNENIPSARNIADRCKLRIVNETGLAKDTMVFIGDKELQNSILSIEISRIDCNSDFCTAKIELCGVKLDLKTVEIK